MASLKGGAYVLGVGIVLFFLSGAYRLVGLGWFNVPLVMIAGSCIWLSRSRARDDVQRILPYVRRGFAGFAPLIRFARSRRFGRIVVGLLLAWALLALLLGLIVTFGNIKN